MRFKEERRLEEPAPPHTPTVGVSVIIPTYNGRQWIAGAIASVLDQKGATTLEVLIVDDCSSDGTPDYVDSLHLERVKVFRLTRNLGVANARNVGIKVAEYPLLGFNDQDDVWLPTKLKRQQQVLIENPHAHGVIGGYARLATDGVSRWTLNSYGLRWSPAHVPKLRDPRRYNLDSDDGCYLQSLLVRRDSAVAIGGFRKGLPLADDSDFIARLSERFPLVCLPEPVFLYRLGDHNQTAPGRAKAQQFLAARSYVTAAAQQRRKGELEPDVSSYMRDYTPSNAETGAFYVAQEIRLLNTLLVNHGAFAALYRLFSFSIWRRDIVKQLFARALHWLRR